MWGRIPDHVARLVSGERQTQGTVRGQRLVNLMSRNLFYDANDPHSDDLAVGKFHGHFCAVGQQRSAAGHRRPVLQRRLQFGDPTIHECELFGELYFVGGIAAVPDRILVAFKVGDEAFPALPKLGQRRDDAVTRLIGKCRWCFLPSCASLWSPCARPIIALAGAGGDSRRLQLARRG